MAFKAVDIDNGGTTGGYDPVLTVPGSAVEGDRMTVIVQTSDNNPSIAPTAPSGWTLEASGSMPVDGTGAVSPAAVWVYGKDVSAADEAGAGSDTYTWTFSGSEEQCGVLILTDPAEFGEFAKNELSGNRTSIDAPSVTTTVDDELYYWCALKDAGTSFTGAPSGTERAHETFGATSGAGAALRVIENTQASPGATGTGSFSHASEESNGYTFSLRPAGDDISSVTPSEFDYDNADIDIAGSGFGVVQGTGTVYISDAATLAGSANEVEIENAIQSWSNTLVNLDLTALNATEQANLQTLGPGARYVILTTTLSAEYSKAVTTHRVDAFTLSASGNIAAGGEATTARLTAPSGKSGSDFTTGRRWDDENGADAIDVAADNYTELEWALEATADAIAGDDYVFRIYNATDSAVLDTYSVTPTWTISSGTSATVNASAIVTTVAFGSPSVGAGAGVTPTAIAVTVAFGAPATAVDADVTPGVIATVVAFGSPVVTAGAGVSPTAVVASISVGSPAIAAGAGVSPTAIATSVTFGASALGAGASVTAAAIATSVAFGTPIVTAGADVGPTAIALTVAFGSPAVASVEGVSPAVIATVVDFGSPTVTAGAGVSPAAVVTSVAVALPTVGAGAEVSPTVITTTVAFGTPTVAAGVGVSPAAISASVAFGSPSLTAGVALTPATVAMSVTFGASSPGAGAQVAPTAIATTISFGSPSIGAGAGVSPSAIALVIDMPAPSIAGAQDVEPGTIVTAIAMPAPTIGAGAGVSLTAVAISVAFGSPSIEAGAGVAPTAIAVSVTIPTPIAGVGGDVTISPSAISLTVVFGTPGAGDVFLGAHPVYAVGGGVTGASARAPGHNDSDATAGSRNATRASVDSPLGKTT